MNILYSISDFYADGVFGTKDNINFMKTLYNDSKTLFELGFNVSVGNIVWNQCKKELTDDNSKTHLIYSLEYKK